MIRVANLQDSFGFCENVTPKVTANSPMPVIDFTDFTVCVSATGDSLDFLTPRFWAAGT